jgi:hypothetical protein
MSRNEMHSELGKGGRVLEGTKTHEIPRPRFTDNTKIYLNP